MLLKDNVFRQKSLKMPIFKITPRKGKHANKSGGWGENSRKEKGEPTLIYMAKLTIA